MLFVMTCACMLSLFSLVRLFVILLIVASQPPLLMGFSRQEYWGGLHALLLGIFPIQASNQHLLGLLQWQKEFFPISATWEAYICFIQTLKFLVYCSLFALLLQASVFSLSPIGVLSLS